MRQTLALGLILISASSYGQQGYGPKGPTVSMAPAPLITVRQGKSATVPLSFRVSSGYHINSNRPKSEFLIPTILKVNATTDILIGRTTYSEGQDMSFAFAPDEKLNVYTGDFQVDVRVRPLRDVQVGKYVVRGVLKYQACDNAACYPPKQLPVSFDLKIAKAPPAPRKNPAQSPHAHR
jgi:Thiol:disulfide interchange protein DsbD, N-terminal